MPKSNLHTLSQPEVATNDPLHELIRQDARDLIAKAVESELKDLLHLPSNSGHLKNGIRYDEVNHGKIDNINEKNPIPVTLMPTGKKR